MNRFSFREFLNVLSPYLIQFLSNEAVAKGKVKRIRIVKWPCLSTGCLSEVPVGICGDASVETYLSVRPMLANRYRFGFQVDINEGAKPHFFPHILHFSNEGTEI